MIIDTELRDSPYGNGDMKRITLSYVDKDGKIKLMYYDIPKNQMYRWVDAKPGMIPDPVIKSWNDKPVCKEYVSGKVNLKDQRIHEIMMDLIKSDERLNVLYELNAPDIAYCDIEVEVDDRGFPRAEDADNRINTIAWVHNTDVIVFGLANLGPMQISNIQKRIDEHCEKFDEDYKFEYRYYQDEDSMLVDFMFNYVLPIPCLTGWNFMGYDWLYLTNRCKKKGIDLTNLSPTGKWKKYALLDMFNSGTRQKVDMPMHKLIFDYMEVYFKWDQAIMPKESYKLDDVGEIAVGVKKVAHALGFSELWAQDPEGYVFYNGVDAILVREIDKKLKTAMALYSLANLMHCDVLTAFSPVRSLEIVQGEYMYKEGKVFVDEKKEIEESEEGYVGAYVYDPIPGKYKNVIALDFASLYPTTMRQFNISPDTYICKDKNRKRGDDEIKCSSGAFYMKNKEGMLPKILTSFYNQRKSYKKEMKIATQEKYELIEILERRMGKA